MKPLILSKEIKLMIQTLKYIILFIITGLIPTLIIASPIYISISSENPWYLFLLFVSWLPASAFMIIASIVFDTLDLL